MSHRDLLVVNDEGNLTSNRAYYGDQAPVVGYDAVVENPPWATGGIPNPDIYLESEVFLAGALSTQAPFAKYHPAWCLPLARHALMALGEWEPTDG